MIEIHVGTRKHNIDLNAKDINGWTPFMKACFNGYTDVIKYQRHCFLIVSLWTKNRFMDQCD